ncbi:unnamed protein product, partial [Porites evermanni]
MLPSNSVCEPSPSDVTLTVDNSGRTLVRFTSRSRTPSPALAMKEGQNDSESSTESETVQCTRTFASASLGLSGSSGTKLSETAYFAAMNKLTNDSGWTLPVFDLESLRQRCPPSSLDICLIGMYPFAGSQYVLATGERVVLVTGQEDKKTKKNTAKKIFKLYSKGKPERVAEIILVSSLSGFSSDTALSALEDLKKAKFADGGVYSLSPLDNLVRAVLYLHQCEPDHAQAALFSIPKKKLVEVLTTHYYLLHEDGTHFTPLAQLLRKHQPAVFLQGLLQLHDKYILSLDTLLTLLGASRPDAHQNELAIGFMEAVLNDKGRVDSFAATVIPLCSVYLERIRSHRRKR